MLKSMLLSGAACAVDRTLELGQKPSRRAAEKPEDSSCENKNHCSCK